MPQASIVWQNEVAPPGYVPALNYNVGVSVAAMDGVTAYWCVVTQVQPTFHAQIFVTHDAMRSWLPTAPLPAIYHGLSDGSSRGHCAIRIDQDNPAYLSIFYGSGDISQAFSLDGGMTWHSLAYNQPLAQALLLNNSASYNGATYIIYNGHLAVSHDGWQTWQPLTLPSGAEGYFPQMYWVDLASGKLLMALAAGSGPALIARSDDGGATWSLNNAPLAVAPGAVARYIPAYRTWVLCASNTYASPPPTTYSLVCSEDVGMIWQSFPLPAVATSIPLIVLGGIDSNGGLVFQLFDTHTNLAYRFDAATNGLRALTPLQGLLFYAPYPTPGKLYDIMGKTVRRADFPTI